MSVNSPLPFLKFLDGIYKVTPNILDKCISGVGAFFPQMFDILCLHDSVGHKVVFFLCDWMIETKEKDTRDTGKHHKSCSCAYL